ncbi:hypothetical protein JOC85_003818 [Bacillus mesophilus]|uniref:Uncharacterized protein n=1 Tax=Bacillus mesophilus TaxID=1808955 RepID=A0A6M0QBE3_9BACI|nr:hypothetical protein [Bacillus mesophilus]MBM7662992.1 hypothetical protein [Bacillus mesophilus]NEY73684.1 hypothetical protein [Bacillus mesophilus]
MMQKLIIILAIVLLGGCSSQVVDYQTEELETEMNQAKEILESEVREVVTTMKQDLSETADEADKLFVSEGETAEITRDVLVPVKESVYEDLYGYIEASNYENIEKMIQAGELLLVEEDTKVKVIERGYDQVKVRIESIEEVGYVPVRYLEQIS